MAGATTRATKDGDTWVIRGAKMWTTGAGHSQYGMCLARTDWDAPKHRGLSMFAVPFDAPGVTIEPITSILGGPAHFFQEFFDDVVIPTANLIGTLNDGWTVAHSLLHHERQATAGIGHGLGLGGGGGHKAEETGNGVEDLIAAAQVSGTQQDPSVRQLIAEAYVASLVAGLAGERVMAGIKSGALRGDWGSLLKLGLGIDVPRRGEIGVIISAGDGVSWSADDAHGDAMSLAWLESRSIAIAGGTNEMQRNIVSERLLGLPREPGSDKDVPFRELVNRRTK
jgi:alkylation response protein AidB-like acyl-CoA dehydrogenase